MRSIGLSPMEILILLFVAFGVVVGGVIVLVVVLMAHGNSKDWHDDD